MRIYDAETIASFLDWGRVIQALHDAHLGPRPQGESFFIGNSGYGLLSRGVVLPGYGAGLMVCSITPSNSQLQPPLPVEQARFLVIDEQSKAIVALMDGPEITRWKTAGDSALAASFLSRVDSRTLLVVGAGPIARALCEAYLHVRPSIRQVLLWNRSPEKWRAAVPTFGDDVLVEVVTDLPAAIAKADIITCATSASEPVIPGALVRPGTHVDLVGGFREEMREADDDLFINARVYVDDFTTAQVSGDICGPRKTGILRRIEGDLYDLCRPEPLLRAAEEITVYKNAGGAHLDLVVAQTVRSLHR